MLFQLLLISPFFLLGQSIVTDKTCLDYPVHPDPDFSFDKFAAIPTLYIREQYEDPFLPNGSVCSVMQRTFEGSNVLLTETSFYPNGKVAGSGIDLLAPTPVQGVFQVVNNSFDPNQHPNLVFVYAQDDVYAAVVCYDIPVVLINETRVQRPGVLAGLGLVVVTPARDTPVDFQAVESALAAQGLPVGSNLSTTDQTNCSNDATTADPPNHGGSDAGPIG